jgi:hypothetical protein
MDVGPRGVISLHRLAMDERLAPAEPGRAAAYLEEGRLLLLQVMGHVLARYREAAHG